MDYVLCNTIHCAVQMMQEQINQGKLNKKTKTKLRSLIHTILCYWTSQPYVGIEKPDIWKNKYHLFFMTLHDYLLILRDSGKTKEKKLAENALYNGKLYRYLGHSEFSENSMGRNQVVEPKYDGIYVSWSKNPNNDYVLNKLNGPITLLTCDTGDSFGIDISAFGFLTGNEQEVVFPTLKNHVLSVNYL